MDKLALIFILEKGYLEQQALLLAESVKTFAASGMPMDMYACCVRKDYNPSEETIQQLQQWGVTTICENLNEKFDYFPLCNGIHAAAYVEQYYPDYAGYLLVDTDTVFTGSLPMTLFQKPALMMRTVDNKGIGSSGDDDPNDEFWQQAFALFDMPLSPPSAETTVRKAFIRPYYNSGFVLAYQLNDFMQHWKNDFYKLMQSEIRTAGEASRYGKDYGFIEQFTLSITASRFPQTLVEAPETINYPIPFRPMLKDRDGHPNFTDLVHVHYHRWFQHPGFLDHVTAPEEQTTTQYNWLKSRLPLQPTIDDPFKC
ncbi:hypothetical protein [Marinicella sp. W31]|uniref:hypothetical protein n=1 Tax=Marinicella sp. W31 TaxID=3023713 RepID=UPI003756A31A